MISTNQSTVSGWIWTNERSPLWFRPSEYSSTVSIFWKQYDEVRTVTEEEEEEVKREERLEGEDSVLLGKKYKIPQVDTALE